MNCQDISLAMDDRDIGALNEAERREFDAHLVTCPDCARDWDVHVRLAATCTPPLPANLHHSIRASLPVQTGGGRRNYGRLVIIGSLVALAAAASMFATHLMHTPKPAVQAADVIPVPDLPAPVLAPEPPEPATAAAPVTAPPGPSPIVEEKSPSVQQPAAVKQRTVRVLSLQNQATGAAFTAVDAFLTAFMASLRDDPGLAVISPDQAESAEAAPAVLRLRVRGFGPVPEGKFTVEISFEKLQSDGSYQLEFVTVPTGDIAPACASSPPFNTMEFCRSPLHVAGTQAQVVGGRSAVAGSSPPADPQAQLLDKTLRAENRLGALLKLQELGRRAEPATIRGAIDLAANATDPRVRAMIWRSMLSVRSPELVPPLVDALQRDPDADVRLQALTTLAVDYADDPRMRAALETSAQQDARPLVRAWARRGLTGEETWNEYIASSLKDTSRPDAERIEALAFRFTEPRPLDLQAFLKDNDALPALTEVLRRVEANSAGGGSSLLLNPRVTAIDDPAITDLVLQRLEKLRGFGSSSALGILGDMLTNHSDKSRIRAALEKISAKDPDPNVRQAAEKMLRAP